MTSAELYKQAYDSHYKAKDLDAAEAGYEQVLEEYPDSPEAGYAKSQLENIEKARNPRVLDVSELEPDSLEGKIAARFVCGKCGGKHAKLKRVALPSAGLGRLVDVQNNFYLSVSCQGCGKAEFYDLNILEGRGGVLSSLLDLWFGG